MLINAKKWNIKRYLHNLKLLLCLKPPKLISHISAHILDWLDGCGLALIDL